MSEFIIPVTEYELATKAVKSILEQSVEEIEITSTLPILDDITDSNKVFKGKLSVLFVDMRKSTDLTDEIKSKKMVKVYRSFIRVCIQAIRRSGGSTRQFAGDGLMGIFQNSKEDDQVVTSAHKAIQAARYIHTLVDYCLNPILHKTLSICVGCGIGICTGTVMIAKVGMRGKESDEKSENEIGAVWVGSTTNYANRYCGLAKSGEIFIDKKTYFEIPNTEVWNKSSRVKGNKLFEGYTVSDYYLQLPEGISTENVKANEKTDSEDTFIKEIFAEVKEKSLIFIDEISKKSAELAIALNDVEQKEKYLLARDNELKKESIRLQQWQSKLNLKQAEVNRKESENNKQAYSIYRSIFSETYCKNSIIKLYRKEYWLDLIQKMYELGEKIGKPKLQVQIDLDCYLIGIYLCFDMYEEAYEVLCIQAEHSSWLNEYILVEVVKNSKHWYKLKNILVNRVNKGQDFQKCLDKLKEMGY